MTHPHAVLLGVPDRRVHDVSPDARSGGGTGEYGPRTQSNSPISTVNVDFLVNAIDDPAVMAILPAERRQSGRRDAAGVGGSPVGPRVPRAGCWSRPGFGLGRVVGRAPDSGASVRRRARRRGPSTAEKYGRLPNASITADAGPSSIDPSIVQPEVIDSIGAAAPDILCVALGNPKQELFIDTYRDLLPCPVMIGVGGSLDMVVGDKKRAPRWLQRVGGEWIFRALQEPGRLGRRYGRDVAVFGPQLIAYVRTVRTYRHGVLLCS